MAELIIQKKRIKKNIKFLSQYFKEREIAWSLITKVFSGDKEFLRNIFTDEVVDCINSVGDSRLTSLINLKETNPKLRTIYLKPPAHIYADDIVKYADVSLNTSFRTIVALNEAALRAGKFHHIIIMIELGELREGINREEVLKFYEKVFNLPNINVIGLGSNLGCMYGVAPTYDKLIQLCLYKELISVRFQKELKLISGGSSITLPMIENGTLPREVNHFRVGEAAFFGISPMNNEQFLGLETETFELTANIIELEEKAIVPDGILSDASIGHTKKIEIENSKTQTFKAILDFGLLDVHQEDIEFTDLDLKFVGITSDMTVIDIGKNKNKNGTKKYKIGDKIKFKANYMGVARLLNSKFIEKVYI